MQAQRPPREERIDRTWRKTASVSRLTLPLSTRPHPSGSSAFFCSIARSARLPSVAAVALTKCGVADRRFDVRSSTVSPVWIATQSSGIEACTTRPPRVLMKSPVERLGAGMTSGSSGADEEEVPVGAGWKR